MKKFGKALSLLLAATMTMGCLAGCSSNKPGASSGEGTVTVTADDKGDVVVWVANEVKEFTEKKINDFVAANPNYSGFTFTVEEVGEGEAAGNMITDVQGGADIFGFAQDQLARLVAAGALNPVVGDNGTWVASSNDAGSVGAAKVGEMIYAYPMTSDNGYFLYYDKSVVTDPSTLEGIVKQCEDANKSIYMEINGGWYQTAFFFGTGCEFTYTTDNDGKFTACNMSYASDAGVVALKEMIELSTSTAFVNGSSIGAADASKLAAIVDGTWDSSAAKDLFGDNYACAKLPTFTGSDGKSYQMSGFGGFKLLGVKPQTDAKKLQVCNALAKYLTSEEVQLERYDVVGWGPSNLKAQASDVIKNDPALSALAQQLAFTIPQGQYPGNYWDDAISLGDDIIAGKFSGYTDAQLMDVLKDFQSKCEAQVQ